MQANYWLILGLILLIGEVLTLDFSLSCFGVACFVAALLSLLGLNIYWQTGAVAVTIFILLFTLRPLALKYLHRAKDFKSNTDALAGKTVTVYGIREDDARKASAKIDGDTWAVQADKPLKDGDAVKIVKIEGITLISVKEEK